MAIRLVYDGAAVEVDIRARRPQLRVRVEGRDYAVTERAGADGAVMVTVDGIDYAVHRAREGDRLSSTCTCRRAASSRPATRCS